MSVDVLLLLEDHHDVEPSWEPQPWVADPRDEPSPRQILLVDDDAVVRRMVERILTRAGYAVASASHGIQALDVALNASPPIDLAITDIRMPRMDGWELGRRLSARWPRLPILYYSGFDREFESFAPGQAHPAAFLSKPFDPDELLRRVALLLEQK